jgi:hypothetical protein
MVQDLKCSAIIKVYDYDFELSYHPGKTNVVVNALIGETLHISTLMTRELNLIEQFRDLSLMCEMRSRSVKLEKLKLVNHFLEEVREYQRG